MTIFGKILGNQQIFTKAAVNKAPASETVHTLGGTLRPQPGPLNVPE